MLSDRNHVKDFYEMVSDRNHLSVISMKWFLIEITLTYFFFSVISARNHK